ncbi:Bro-N domain-containing protein [Acidithiobacillus sp. IBUN Pt1247-S3]|uniref:BRO-N domain-containing protein n=1 Tax=Acidithiobacillus sp. IBUN Pt1247-S3 TaxID=3166642 RepID=UPI0034E3F8A0
MTTPNSRGAAAPLQASTPVVFQFHSLEVRTLERDGQIWFVASDVAQALGYREAERLTRWLDDDEKGTHIVGTLGGDQTVTILSESGLYHALLKSRRPEAKPFRRWVTQEVLPAIRQQGGYVAPQAAASAHLVALPGMKLLLTFDADGRYRAEPVPEGAMVVTAQQIADIVEANGYILAKPVDKGFKL